MCTNNIPNLMMQPQEYCSCYVCGNSIGSQRKKCTFDGSEQDSRDSESSSSPASTRVSKLSCTPQLSSDDQETECSERSLKKSSTTSSKKSLKMSSKRSSENEASITALCPPDEPFDCNNEFTPSGMQPAKTAGPFGRRFDCCSKYAPCGHWNTCTTKGHQHDKLFEGYGTCCQKAPYGPYGPWTKFGPSKFKSPFQNVIDRYYPKRSRCHDGFNNKRTKHPMGKLRPWPLAGSCRYAGRPYGPCRPFGAYRARGPFGVWEDGKCEVETIRRPSTPCQPCWRPRRPGFRPCTPCHRPNYVPCKSACIPKGKCNFKNCKPVSCLPVCVD